jgi:dethiobiotin synthetase
MKPIAAGAEMVAGEFINEDAARLRAAGSFDPGLALLNPYCLASPIAPTSPRPKKAWRSSPAHPRAFERSGPGRRGAGGRRGRLSRAAGRRYDTADLARDLALPVILVVGMRLGCINHALLTAEAIQAARAGLAGWVANQVDPAMLRFQQNLDALRRMPAPLLGVVPFPARRRRRSRQQRLPTGLTRAGAAARTGTPRRPPPR